MIVKQAGEKIEIKFQYNPYLVSFVKALPGRHYNPGTKSWFIPLAGSLSSIERLAGKGFEIDAALVEAVAADERKAAEVEALAVMNDAEFESSLPLFPYQKVGASFLYRIGSGLLGDEMGLGKTIQSLALCEKVGAQKVLIFTPASVKHQWADEIRRFIPTPNEWRKPPSIKFPFSGPNDPPEYSEESHIAVIDGNKKKRIELWRGDYRFYVANYELLLHDLEHLQAREWDVIIADEATRISNADAKQSKAIKKIKAKRRIAMTGTPISNKAQEVWNIVDFTNPGSFGNYWSFLQRYCVKNQWGGIYKYQNMEELRTKLKRYMIRRMKVDVLPELPDKIITDIPFLLNDEERELYKKLKKEILFEIEHTDIAKIQNPMTIQYTLVKLLRLRQLADSMELLGHNVQSSKLSVLKELVSEVIVEGRKAIIFTQFAAMADILERELAEYKPLKISGSIDEEYHEVVKRFNDVEDHQVLIMTSAGQFGLNIQRASVIFHYDQEWSLAKMEQRDGRAHRYGQKDTVLVYNLLAKGTVDYYVKKILHAKAELSTQLLGDAPISMNEIRDMLKYGEEDY